MKYCAVIPAFREASRITPVVEAVKSQQVDAVVVDDGSGDGTAEAAEAAGAIVLRHGINQGKGVALKTGFDYALEQNYDAVITLDADGQHDPGEIPSFLETYRETGLPVLAGNRMANIRDMPLIRRWTNQFMSWLLSRQMGQFVPDTQCGYRMYAAEALPHVRADSGGFAAESEQLLYLADHGFPIGSVPVRTIYGDEKSKIHPVRDSVRFFSMLRRYRKAKRSKQ